MLRLSIAFACLFSFISAASAEIDFSPILSTYASYGAEHTSVSFKDEKRTVSMQVPRKWSCRGDASRLVFTPPEQNFAEGIVQAAPPMRTSTFDEATVKALEAYVINTLPSGSQGVTVIGRLENSVILNQNLSYEIVVSYQALGQTFHRSVIFVNSPEAQLIFRFTAPKATFASLNSAFNRSVCSWYVTEPTAALSGPVTASK